MSASCVYEGWVRHRRYGTVEHNMHHRLFMMYLDLDELPDLFDDRLLWSARRPAIAWFRRADHLGDPAEPLAESVRRLVELRTGRRPDGPVRLLTHLRYLGHCFNPVSFYYCYGVDGQRPLAVVAEVTNTPWGERHAYVLSAGQTGVLTGQFDKRLHVSPLMGMDHVYDWRLTEPGHELSAHIDSRRDGVVAFDATLSMQRRELSAAVLRSVLVRHPAMTVRMVAHIYGHAARLRLKGARYFPNPSGTPPAGAARRRAARVSRQQAGSR
jgi:DUF1365 family protein